MEPRTRVRVRPIDSFVLIYKLLAMAGYYKHLVKPKSYVKYMLQQMYRLVAFLIIVAYNLAHLIFIYQTGDFDTVFEVMVIEINELNLLVKFLVYNLGSCRLDKINEALRNDPMFLPTTKKDEELLKEDTMRITRLVKFTYAFMTFVISCWTLSFFLKRAQDPEFQIHAYIPLPFDNEGWFGFTVAVMIYTILLFPWITYGYLAFDFATAAYYLQAQTQLKIIKYNLERIHQGDDSDLEVEDITQEGSFQYRDLVNPSIKRRFAYYVRRYEKVAWYTKEVDRALDKAIGFSFLSTAFSVCMNIIAMGLADTNLLQVGILALLTVVQQSQVFLYCYVGGVVTEESASLSTSLYLSEWWRLSGAFRRGMLVAMTRWAHPLVPRVSSFVIVPLSLTTFIAIVRSSYSLFSVMNAAKS